ncbi:MAG TPA: tetratricopeptide repeat protein [Vicinamibacteria bacterium]|nr:tetratricopeptide repeat protein [Vicinamibacteria bacterium]
MMTYDVTTRDRVELTRLAQPPAANAPPEEHLRFAEALVLLRSHFGDSPGSVAQTVIDVTTRVIEGPIAPPMQASARATRGFARYVLQYDWHGAKQDFDAAVGYGPSSLVHLWRADFFTALACHDEAIAEIGEVTSNAPIVERDRARAHYFARNYDEAISILTRLLQREPDFAPARALLGRAYVQRGNPDRGVAELLRAGSGYEAILAWAYACAGLRGDAEEVLGSLVADPASKGVLPYEIALVHLALGHIDEALTWLRIAYEQRDPSMTDLATDPALDGLRNDDRYRVLVREVGFPLVFFIRRRNP